MRYTINELIKGNYEILEWYKYADNQWNKIFSSLKTKDSKKLAEMITTAQIPDFEWGMKPAGRYKAQEIMVTVGFARLYSPDDGFGERKRDAQLLKRAFEQSMCSLEVKYYAKEIADFYGVDD